MDDKVEEFNWDSPSDFVEVAGIFYRRHYEAREDYIYKENCTEISPSYNEDCFQIMRQLMPVIAFYRMRVIAERWGDGYLRVEAKPKTEDAWEILKPAWDALISHMRGRENRQGEANCTSESDALEAEQTPGGALIGTNMSLVAKAESYGITRMRMARWDRILEYLENALSQEDIAEKEKLHIDTIKGDFHDMKEKGYWPIK